MIGACDAALKELREEGRHPVPIGNMTVRDAFRRMGAEEWDRVREAYREPKPKAAE